MADKPGTERQPKVGDRVIMKRESCCGCNKHDRNGTIVNIHGSQYYIINDDSKVQLGHYIQCFDLAPIYEDAWLYGKV